jgi:hypothetical protein
MDVFRYLVAVLLLAGMLVYAARWTITPPSGAVAGQAEASDIGTASIPPAAAASAPPLAALSPVYPTMVGKGLALSTPSAERMRKKLQGHAVERPQKKRQKAAQRQKNLLPAGANAFASSPAPSPPQAYLPYTSEENR